MAHVDIVDGDPAQDPDKSFRGKLKKKNLTANDAEDAVRLDVTVGKKKNFRSTSWPNGNTVGGAFYSRCYTYCLE